MIPAQELLGKRETVFTYHEDGVTRCWAVERILRDIESGALAAEITCALLVARTARTLVEKGGLSQARIAEIVDDPVRLSRPGVLMYPERMNDRNPLIVDGRHRYAALCVLGRDMTETPYMNFHTFSESDLSGYEIEMERNFTEEQARVYAAYVSDHRV